MTSENTDVQIHVVKVVANLATKDLNQIKIMEEGGLHALLIILQSSTNTTIIRVTYVTLANLAMSEVSDP